MDNVRIGVIGIGNRGSGHASYIVDGDIAHAQLTAVCDVDPGRLDWAKENLGQNVRLFEHPSELIDSGAGDAVLIATPH